MKFKLALIGALMFGTSAMAADPVEGVWKTQPGDTGGWATVQIKACGAKICGYLKAAFDEKGVEMKDYEHKGRKMIWDMEPDGKGGYYDGQIWAADRDKTYSSKMFLEGGALTVKGCVLGICRGQTWSRVK